MLLSDLALTVLLGVSFANGIPHPLHKRSPPITLRRGCGNHVSHEKMLVSERRFSASRVTMGPLDGNVTIGVRFNNVAANETGEGGWVSDSQIREQIDVLNKDHANTGVSWRLDNISRIISQDWFENAGPDTPQESAMKQVFRVGDASVLNVYTVSFAKDKNGLLGYATFPIDYATSPKSDGVVIRYSTLPRGSSAPFNLGRTLTHEAGHWAGLYHTFQGGCDSPGDSIDDTSPEEDGASGCPFQRNTCPGADPDPIHNFMDYTDDSCMEGFTPGQAERMRMQLRTYRGNSPQLS